MSPTAFVLLQLAPPDLVESAQRPRNIGRLDAIQQHFQRQGTVQDLLLGALVVVAIVLVAFFFGALQKRGQPGDVHRPAKLFRRLLLKLGLTVPQRDILSRMISDLGLENPTVLLLSRRIFENQSRLWLAGAASSVPDADRRLAELAGVLYPTETPERAISTTNGGSPPPEGTTPSSTLA